MAANRTGERGLIATLVVLALLLAPRAASAHAFLSLGIQPLTGATSASSSTNAAIAPYDVVGIVGMPVIAGGMYALGHLIDKKVGNSSSDSSNSGVWDKVFLVLGVGMDYVGMKYLGNGLGVPTSWASTAVGFGFGFAAFGLFIGLDAICLSVAGLEQSNPVVGILALLGVAAWSVTSTILISTDPFHLANPDAKKGTATATFPLMSLPL